MEKEPKSSESEVGLFIIFSRKDATDLGSWTVISLVDGKPKKAYRSTFIEFRKCEPRMKAHKDGYLVSRVGITSFEKGNCIVISGVKSHAKIECDEVPLTEVLSML